MTCNVWSSLTQLRLEPPAAPRKGAYDEDGEENADASHPRRQERGEQGV